MQLSSKNLLWGLLLAASTVSLAECDSSCDGESSSCAFPDAYHLNVNNNIYGMTNFTTHPVQWDMFRRMSGASTEKLHLFGAEETYGLLSLAVQYQQTTESNRFAQWFAFNNEALDGMTYGPTSGQYDINSLNFGVTATGKVTMCPRIQNVVADIDFFVGWDGLVCGLWSRVSCPINYTRWNLNLADESNGAGSALFAEDVMVANNQADVVYADLKSAWVGDLTFGDATTLDYGKIDGAQHKTAVAGLKLELGYDFLRRERSHLALSLMAVAPTGNKPKAVYLFEPISGSGGCWEVGGDLNAHYNFWENQDCNQTLGIHFDLSVVAQLKHSQTRLFGLKAGLNHTCSAGASWLLLKEFDASEEYAGVLPRAANILALQAQIGAGFEADLGLILKYSHNHLSADFGYELYYRHAEKICSRDAITANKYAIKGSTNLDVVTINETDSTATISTNGDSDGATQVFIKDSDVCVCTALQPAYLSNKFFNFYQYAWDNCNWEPTLGAGYSYEIGSAKQGVKNIAANQWSVMAKGSISF